MNTYKSFKELKKLTYEQAQWNPGVLIGSILLQQIITILVSFSVSALIPTTTLIGDILNYIVVFIIQILSLVLQSGLYFIYLKIACNMPCATPDLFEGFKVNTTKIIKISFILSIINTICNIPCEILYKKLMLSIPAEINTSEALNAYIDSLLIYFIITLACVLLFFLVTLPLQPAFYMVWDYPESNVRNILKQSICLMKGHKLRYLLLTLSFLPSILISFLFLGLPLLWIIPTMNLTFTNFYLDLISVKNSNNTY